jgi:hypothetical protein
MMSTPEPSESSADLPKESELKECSYCRKEISAHAIVCQYCRCYQHPVRHNLVNLAHAAALAGILLTSVNLYFASQQRTEARHARIAAVKGQEQAETAGKTAETAARQASEARERINAVEAQVVSQSAMINQVAQQAQSAKTLYEDLKEKGRQLEANLKILAYRQQDRVVPKDMRNKIIEKLAEKKGESIQITSVNGDQEAEQFARELNDIFQQAGWEVKPFTRTTFTRGPVQNVTVRINNMKHASLAFHIVSTFESFTVFNDPPIRRLTETEQQESLQIVVGTKTIPPLRIVPD